MASNIDSMAWTGSTPWHRQGVQVQDPMTAEQAIKTGGLDWEVEKVPLFALNGERNIRVKDTFATRRTDRLDQLCGGHLGVVGRGYHPLQNRDAFSFLDPLRLENEAVFHTVGALDGGRRVWLLAKLPSIIRVIGDDITEKYLLVANSHDGTSAVNVLLTPMRVVCQNTLNLALHGGGGISIRHFSNVHDKVKQAHLLLGIVNTTYDRAEVSMQAMTRVQMTSKRLKGYFNAVMPLPEEETEKQRVQVHHQRLEQLFTEGDGNQLPGVRGTLWAAYNGVTQFGTRESYSSRMKSPLKSIWFGRGRQLNERAFSEAGRLLNVYLN